MRLKDVDLESSAVGEQLDRALRTDGFAQLWGHGIAPAEIDALRLSVDGLFDLPLDTKLRHVIEEPLANRGYRSRGSESLSYALGAAAPPDLFESFNVGHDNRSDPPLMSPTPWPTAAPDFVAAAQRHLDRMADLAARLDGVVGPLIDQPDLVERSRNGPDTMASIRYRSEPDEASASPSQHRMGAHSDYTTFTILTAEPVLGLEILRPDGWHAVTPEPGALLLNVGDLLAMWTNDRWPSTVHRVPIRNDGTDPPVRRTVAYFHYPDLDEEVTPAPRFGPAKYPATTARVHLAAMLAGPKRLERSTGTSTLDGRPFEPGGC